MADGKSSLRRGSRSVTSNKVDVPSDIQTKQAQHPKNATKLSSDAVKTVKSESMTELATQPTRIQRIKMEAFIKVIGSRKVTIEVLSADGQILSTDVEEVDDEPEVFKISSQEKMSYGDPSTFQIQKPETFILPHQFLKKTNFRTSLTLKCPKFVKGDAEDSQDPVFTSLNKILVPEDNNHVDIQAIKTNVTLQMKDWKITNEPKNRFPRKPKETKTTKSLESNSVDDLVILGGRESKRIRKPTKKMLEYQELEKSESGESDKQRKYITVHSIKREPGVIEESTENLNSNNNKTMKTVKTTDIIKTEIPHESKLNPESGVVVDLDSAEQKTEEIEGKVLTTKEVGELLNIPSLMDSEAVEQTELKTESSDVKDNNTDEMTETSDVRNDMSDVDHDTSEDYTIFDDEVYEKKYGQKFQPPPKRLPCRFCPAVFKSRVVLNRHMNKHRKALNIEKDVCEVCKKTFSNRYVFECHKLIHTHETEDGKYKCSICNKIFISRSGLLKHQRSDKDCKGTEFKCEYCGAMYNSLQTLDIHRRRTHIAEFHKDKETCKNCGKTFETKGGLNKHMNKKACQVLFTCETCGKTFSNETRFEKHKQTHVESSKPSTVCETCGKSLSTPAALAVHKNSHLNIRNFECKVCHKTFVQKGTLVAHERIHTGSRPYLCNTCGAAFRYNSHLSQHQNLHTGKIKYPCTKCERSFLTKHSLKKHMISHARRERISEMKGPSSVELTEIKQEQIEIPADVVAEDEVIYLNEVVGEDNENTQYRYIYTTEDGQQFLTNSADTIIASDQHIEYQDGQNVIYQTVEGENVTFVDEMQTSDLNILAETAQNYENSGVTYVIVKK